MSQPYNLRLTYHINETIYDLLTPANTLIESVTIAHRTCTSNSGWNLGFYFGGQCPAPQEVSCCYESNPTTKNLMTSPTTPTTTTRTTHLQTKTNSIGSSEDIGDTISSSEESVNGVESMCASMLVSFVFLMLK